MALLQPMGIKAVAEGVGQFNKKVDSMNKSIDKTNKSTAKAEKSSLDFRKVMVGLGAAVGVATVALVGMKKVLDFGREGALITQTGESFDFLIKKIGASTSLLEELTAASRGTISEMELMTSTATLLAGAGDDLALSLADATPQLLEIAKAANKLNPSLGSTAFLYQSIATGVKRAQPLILDNLGITIKVGEANKAFAKSIGKTVEELTAEEKAMAILAGTLKAGDNLIQQVGGSTDSLTDSFDRLGVGVTEAGDRLKKAVFTAIEPAVDSLADMFEESNKVDKIMDTFGVKLNGWTGDWELHGRVIGKTREEVIAWAEETRMADTELVGWADGMSKANIVIASTSTEVKGLKETVEGASWAYQSLNTNIGGTVSAISEQIAFLAAGGGELIGLAEEVGLAFQEDIIDEETAQNMLEQIGLAGLAIEEEIGNVQPWEAQQTAVEEYGSEWDTVKSDIDEARTKIEEIPTEIRTEITVRVHAILTGLSGLPGLQHGGQFQVGGKPGVDQNLVAFRATRGEVVTVTPTSSVDNRSVNMGDVNMGGGGMSPQTFDRMIRSWMGA